MVRTMEEEEELLKGTKQRVAGEGEGLLLRKKKQNLSGYREPPLLKPTKAIRTTLLATQIEPSIPQNTPTPGHLAAWLPPSQAEVSPRTAAKHSSARYPYGNPVVPRIPQKVSLNNEEVRRGTHVVGHMGVEEQVEMFSEAVLQSSPCVLPKVVTFEFQGGISQGRGGIGDHTQTETALKSEKAKESHSPRPRRAHIVQVPRHHLPSSAHSYSQRPFSEEVSSVSPEARVPQESPSAHHPALEQPQNNQEENVPEHCPISTSVSPDYMLVGAHFSGDQLVLLDREEQVIHQLTDTESSANLAFNNTNVVISGTTLTRSSQQPDPLAPTDGTRAPPPTGSREQDTDGTRAPTPTGSIVPRGQDLKQVQPVEIPAPLTEDQEEEDKIRSDDAVVDVAQREGTENTDDITQHDDTISTTNDPVDQTMDKTSETMCSREPDAAQKSSEDLTTQTEPVKGASQAAKAVAESTVM